MTTAGLSTPTRRALPPPRARAKGTRRTVTPADQVTAYARDVVAGSILTNRLVRLACERHLRDMERVDLQWDAAAAEKGIAFFCDVLRLPDSGRRFVLSPHQAFYVGSMYGWKKPNGTLRFAVGYVEISKGDGKTPTASGICLRAVCAERVRGAQVYAAASKKDQAMNLFRDAVAMRDSSPELARRLKTSGTFPHTWNLAHVESGSFFRPISSEDAQSGPRVYRAAIDELHEHRTATVLDLMVKGLKGRADAFVFIITNSGFDRTSVCWREHEYSVKVLEGVIHDDSRFAFIAGLDPCAKCRSEGKEFPTEDCKDCDDWRDERVWPKAAPNLDVSVTRDYYRREVNEAKGMPTVRNMTKRLLFCIWTEGQEKWLPIEEWTACKRVDLCNPAALRGRRCFAGIDLAGTSDLAALVLYFPPVAATDPGIVLPYFFLPKDSIEERMKLDRVPYDLWVERGLIEATDGNVTDYRQIRAKLKELREASGFVVVEVPFDPDDATQLSTELVDDGFVPVPFYQSKKLYTPAVKEVERLIAKRGIAHAGHEVMDWNFSNVIMERNRLGQVKPIKGKNREKNDGMVGLFMGVGRALLHSNAPKRSVYEDRGLTVIGAES